MQGAKARSSGSGKETKSERKNKGELVRAETSMAVYKRDSLGFPSEWCLRLLGGVSYRETRMNVERLDIPQHARGSYVSQKLGKLMG